MVSASQWPISLPGGFRFLKYSAIRKIVIRVIALISVLAPHVCPAVSIYRTEGKGWEKADSNTVDQPQMETAEYYGKVIERSWTEYRIIDELA
jgi:hypothetical protein